MFFRQVNDGMVYKTLTILMRVDSQINDKDLRDKRKLFDEFSPLDFGIDDEFCMMNKKQIREIKSSTDLTVIHEDIFSINNSQVKNSDRKSRATIGDMSHTVLAKVEDDDESFEVKDSDLTRSLLNTSDNAYLKSTKL